MPDEYTIGDLARQDIYPDETQMQPPQNAVGGLTPEDWMMSGQQPPAATYDYVPPQSWLQKAGDLARRDVATYQQGGVPAMMGQLAEDSSGEQDLAGGFGGNIKGVEGKLGAIADLAPHAPPFYSAVEQAVQGAKQTTAPGQQWAGFLRNQPGVKPEEIGALKLGDLFDQTGAVTKQDLLDHIAANKVQLGEVVKGDGPKFEFGTPDEQSAATQRYQTARQAINNMPANEIGTHEWNVASAELGAAEAAMRDVVPGWGRAPDSTVSPTKFSQYTLPGGENYRETLLTLPDKGQPSDWQVVEHPSGVGYSIRNSRGEYGLTPDGTRDAVFSTPDNARASIADYAATQSERPEFKSSHFDEPNILAHIRTNDRVIDGKKTLFVEEVQSDWHQKGKRSGYDVPDAETLTDLPQGYRIEEHSPLRGESGPTYSVYDPNGERLIGNRYNRQSAINEVVNELNSQRRAERGLSGSPVPDAPFKTTWPDLAMKRIIREAAEKGYDKVAWTPGSVQADRYDLSKQVSKINAYRVQNAGEPVLKDGQPQYRVQAHDKDGRLALDQYVVERDLPDTIGKDLADKIIKARDGAHDYSGLDLKVGGEGMKGFYDQILPAAVNKIVKKAGGRVGQGEIQGSGPDLIEEGRGNYRKPRPDETDTYKVHTLDITPQLREMALKKGFPLFTAGGLVAGGAMGDLAKQDEYQ